MYVSKDLMWWIKEKIFWVYIGSEYTLNRNRKAKGHAILRTGPKSPKEKEKTTCECGWQRLMPRSLTAARTTTARDDGGGEDGEAGRWWGREDGGAASLIFALAWCADSVRRRSTATRDARVDWQRSGVTGAVVGRRGGFTSAVGWSR
jgi:hypothetical protein